MIPMKQRLVFYEKLERLTSSGNTLDKSLKLCAKGQKGELLSTIERVLAGINSNQEIDKIIKKISTIPFQERALLIAGFRSGKLPKTLLKMCHYLEALIELKSKFLSTVVPNLLLFQFALLIMPTIQAMANNSSPLQLAMNIIQYLAIVNSMLFICYLKIDLILKLVSSLILKIPVIGAILINYELYKFSLIYAQCVDAGLPVQHCFQAGIASLLPTPLKKEIHQASLMAAKGLSFFDFLYKSTYIPFESVNQWEIGHQSGKEDKALEDLSKRSLKESLSKLGLLSYILQKVILVIVAITIFLSLKSMVTGQFEQIDEILKE